MSFFQCESCGFHTKTSLKFCPKCRGNTWKVIAKLPALASQPVAVTPLFKPVAAPMPPTVRKPRGQVAIAKPSVVAAILLVVALFVAGLVKSTDQVAAVLADSTSLDAELALADDTVKQVRRESKILPPENATSVLVNTLGQRLVDALPADSRYKQLYNFSVIVDSDVNAFAAPGGAIFVHTGLLDLIKNNSTLLSAVLAHEIMHVERRHGLKGFYQNRTMLVAVVWTFGLASDFGLTTATALIATRHSRKQELEADALGSKLLQEAGITSAAMPEMLRRLALAKSGIKIPQWLNSHPDPESRAAALEVKR